jgi:histidine ammonia-lyase
MTYIISPDKRLNISEIQNILVNNLKLELSDKAKQRIVDCRLYLDKKMASQKEPIYGINTGFGSLCNVRIPDHELEQLQTNLLMSHASGMGNEVSLEIVKLMLLLKIQALSFGKSAVQLTTVERLVDFYNLNIYPIVYEQGSLGASGDLSPLAHLCLPLLGLGHVNYQGNKYESSEVLKQLGLEPIKLKSKEGLALLNGTQFMAAYGVWCLIKSNRLNYLADLVSALSLDAFDGRIEPFNDNIHLIRPHKGQLKTARNIRTILEGSEIIKQVKVQVQDPYSFRCIPQVHGATKDACEYVQSVFETEINSVTDNPTIFCDEDEIISAGNFHGQPLALSLDFMAIAISELGSISERRVYQLISGSRNLPAFLVAKPGLNSGFMIPQYTAASIVSQNKQLCSPASVDSIVSSNGQEDHVSMGGNAATKCFKVIENVERLMAIELLNASQALEFRKPLKSSPTIQNLVKELRVIIPFINDDKIMYQELEATLQFIKHFNISVN